jgi:hypothetical protein
MNTQLSRYDRLHLADDVILNFDQQPDVDAQIKALHVLYCEI